MRYCIEPDGEPEMPEEEALALWRRACDCGGADDRDRLAENFQPMVEAEAVRLSARFAACPGGGAAEDFPGWGNLGLLRALCCYRPESPIGFYEFCRRRVCETMLEEARAYGSSAVGGIAGAAEVARLWGELSREFSSPVFGVIKMAAAESVPGGLRLGVG